MRALARPICFALGLAMAAGARAADEVPFVVTPDRVTDAMLELAGVGPADHVIDLGSGNGRIVITAARRFGASGLGVEIVAELVARSRAAARVAGLEGRAIFREQDLFATDLSAATVVTMYLLPDVNLQLRPRLLALRPGTRIVSHDWAMGDWLPERSIVVDVPDKAVGHERFSRVHLWVVPARAGGTWCERSSRLEIEQRFQRYSAALHEGAGGAPPQVWDGRIDARVLTVADSSAAPRLEIAADGRALRLVDGATERTFLASPAGRCPN